MFGDSQNQFSDLMIKFGRANTGLHQTREHENRPMIIYLVQSSCGGERETLHPVMPDIIAGPAGGGGGGPDPVLWTSGRGSVSLQAGRTQEHL